MSITKPFSEKAIITSNLQKNNKNNIKSDIPLWDPNHTKTI